MIAVLGGLGAAVLFATATLSAARGSRLVGAESFLAGVMTVGLVIAVPFVALGGAPAGLDEAAPATSPACSSTTPHFESGGSGWWRRSLLPRERSPR